MDPSVKDVHESMKLAGPSNYVIWSYKVKMILMQEGLWKYIEPGTSRPAADTATSGSIDSNVATGGGAATGAAHRTIIEGRDND